MICPQCQTITSGLLYERCPSCNYRFSEETKRNMMVEQIIDGMLPSLRVALAQVLAGNAAHMFTAAEGSSMATGGSTKLMCFITMQHVGILLESVLKGSMDAEKFVMEQMQKAAEFQQNKVTM